MMKTKYDFHGLCTDDAVNELQHIILDAYNSKFEGEVALITGLGRINEQFLQFLDQYDHNYRVNSSNLGCIWLNLDYADQWGD